MGFVCLSAAHYIVWKLENRMWRWMGRRAEKCPLAILRKERAKPRSVAGAALPSSALFLAVSRGRVSLTLDHEVTQSPSSCSLSLTVHLLGAQMGTRAWVSSLVLNTSGAQGGAK